MSDMDHAAAHERIEDLSLEPARLRSLSTSTDAADLALVEHLAGCPTCRADLEGWSRVQADVRASLPSSERGAFAAVHRVEVPPRLRADVLAAVRAEGMPAPATEAADTGEMTRIAPSSSVFRRPAARRAPESTRARRRPIAREWLAVAASLVILVGAAAITLDQSGKRARAETEVAALTTLAAAMDEVLATDHKVVELRTTAGATAGSIAWSRHDWVVLTSALTAPAPGQRYLCWLEDGAKSVAVGTMEFSGDTAWWVASLDDWQTWEIGPQTRFVVSLEADGATKRTGPPVLQAALGS
ncbi:MAG TPA: anti-sigma factor [Candidatus Limnocylindria bacterium]|nr:anti-sigma factor [Candidatus Limnocylindria bacterium]